MLKKNPAIEKINPLPKLTYGVSDLEKLLNTSRSTVYELIRSRRLPAYRLHKNCLRITHEDLQQFILNSRVGG